ncbi:DUF5302 domain-containing protein [Mycobacterium sp. NPDC050041]|uniref:DUF5302 domain-containing protein n=1 Tax=Mycobacterium sp. NPDC050041 TaxID=3364293 RepID=UPI003C2DB73E
MADEPVTESNGDTTGAAAPDDTRQKFREALERKKANAGGGAAHKDGGRKQPRAHGPQESRREFRRKSG